MEVSPMSRQQSRNLRERVILAAETCLERDGSVGPLELLQELGFLHPVHVQAWRKGNPYYATLEPSIQCGVEKLETTYRYFQEWIHERRLQPIEASYVRSSPKGVEPLQITDEGDPEREKFFRTHYAPVDISTQKTQRLKEKLSKAPDLVTYELVSNESRCSECQAELFRGNLLFLEKGQPLCLSCADLDHLAFLPRGDAALSRRARRYSPLSAIVVRFSRARKRYERQGILVTPEALARAEQECLADADERAAQRERDAARRREEDRDLVDAMTQAIRARYPRCPAEEARRLAEHASQRSSGRVGRSASGRAVEDQAIDLAVIAWTRHHHTDYDLLLMQGIDRQEARNAIRAQLDQVLSQWSGE
jgi:hypothetical protein